MARSDLTGELRSSSSRDPIYEQVARQIRTQIIAGKLPDGTPLPSIRKLADELQISVITTKRAYEELEQEGEMLGSVVGTEGTAMTDSAIEVAAL